MSSYQKISSKLLSLYKWFFSQDEKNIIVKFDIPSDFNPNDILIDLQDNQTIEVYIMGEIPFLKGTLSQPIKSYETSVFSNFFILTLIKNEPIEWKYLIMSASKKDLKADPKSCFLLGVDNKDKFPNEPISPLLSLSALYHYPAACIYIGNYYFNQGNKEDALENYKMIADEFNDPTAELQTGVVLVQLNRIDEGIEYLRKSSDSGNIAAKEKLKEIENIKHEKKAFEEVVREISATEYTVLTDTAALETAAIGSAALQACAIETAAIETAAEMNAMKEEAKKEADEINASVIGAAAIEKAAIETEAIETATIQATAVESAVIQAAALESSEIQNAATEAVATAAIESAAIQNAIAGTAAIQATAAEQALEGIVIESITERNAELDIEAAEAVTAETTLLGTAEAADIEEAALAQANADQNQVIQPTAKESKTDKTLIIMTCVAVGVSLAFLFYKLKRNKH